MTTRRDTLRNVALIIATLWASPFTAQAQDAPPQRAKFEFTAQQVKDFGTTRVQILPDVPGYYYRVAHGTFVKRAGGAFTLASNGHYVQIQYGNSSHTPANNFLVHDVLDTTDEASATGNPASISQLTTAGIGSVGLWMGVNGGGAYTGDGEACILDLYYWLLPSDAGELDLVDTTPLP